MWFCKDFIYRRRPWGYGFGFFVSRFQCEIFNKNFLLFLFLCAAGFKVGKHFEIIGDGTIDSFGYKFNKLQRVKSG